MHRRLIRLSRPESKGRFSELLERFVCRKMVCSWATFRCDANGNVHKQVQKAVLKIHLPKSNFGIPTILSPQESLKGSLSANRFLRDTGLNNCSEKIRPGHNL